MPLTLEQKRYQASQLLMNALVMNAPKDTWNLALNGIRLMADTSGEYEVVIGGEVAPYAVYTNEPWTQGKNPNEHWIEKTIEQVSSQIKQIFSGTIEKQDVDRLIGEMENDIRSQHKSRLQMLEQELARKKAKLENM